MKTTDEEIRQGMIEWCDRRGGKFMTDTEGTKECILEGGIDQEHPTGNTLKEGSTSVWIRPGEHMYSGETVVSLRRVGDVTGSSTTKAAGVEFDEYNIRAMSEDGEELNKINFT